jgi:hypothetical protein
VLVSLALALIASVEVGGPAACPAPKEVELALATMLADGGSGRATISEEGPSAVAIDLLGPDGDLLGRRRLERNAPCEDLARAAAVMIASWVEELPSEAFLPRAGAVASEPGAARGLGQDGTGQDIRLGIAISGSVGSGVAPGAAAELWYGALRLGLFGALERTGELGPGQYAFFRTGATLGGQLALTRVLGLRGDLIGALASVRGSGYATVYQRLDLAPGLSLGVRAARPRSRAVGDAVVQAKGIGWGKTEHVLVTGLGDSRTLPRLELLLSAGIVFGEAGR